MSGQWAFDDFSGERGARRVDAGKNGAEARALQTLREM
jgi:hypothetical protein